MAAKVRSLLTGSMVDVPNLKGGTPLDIQAAFASILVDLTAKAEALAMDKVKGEIEAAQSRARSAEAERDAAKTLQAAAEARSAELNQAVQSLERTVASVRTETASQVQSLTDSVSAERSRYDALESRIAETNARLSSIEETLGSNDVSDSIIQSIASLKPEPTKAPHYQITPVRNRDGLITSITATPVEG